MAYSSRRFLALPAVLGAAVVAAGLRGVTSGWSPSARTRAAVAAVVVVFAYAGVAGAVTRRRVRPDVLQKVRGPQGAAGFVSRFAPEGARLFNSYNDGPWLVWTTAPRVRHYIDPRNNVGSAFVADYRQRIVEPAQFDLEAASQRFTLAMLDLDDAFFQPLVVHLDLSPDWRPVYLDTHRVVYARLVADNERLLKEHGYSVLRARASRQDLAVLSPSGLNDLNEDLRRLGRSAPRLRDAISACVPILTSSRLEEIPPDALALVVSRLDEAVANDEHLSGMLTACVGQSVHRLRGAREAFEVLSNGEDEVGGDATFRGVVRRLTSTPPAPPP